MGGWAIALHGGAGMICKEKMSVEEIQRTEAALYQILDIGVTALENNNNNKMMTAVDVVELVVSNNCYKPLQLQLQLLLNLVHVFIVGPRWNLCE